MSTPEQHQEQAETLLAAATTRGAFQHAAEPKDFGAIEVHTLLSRATGTGSHYSDAEAALVEAFRGAFPDTDNQLRIALAHARLADR